MPFISSARGAYGPQGKKVIKGPLAPVWVTSGAITAGTVGSAYSYQLVATDDSGDSPTYSIASGSLPSGLSLSSSGLISGTPTTGGENPTFTVNATDINGRTTTSSGISINVPVQGGSVLYRTAGSYTWTVPSGVTSISVVAVGGGGSSYPQSYENGAQSYFNSTGVVFGNGGGTSNAPGGSYGGDGGGTGGGTRTPYGGGGGAGGYSGTGGTGAIYTAQDATAGNGGGGGGGGTFVGCDNAGGGGGVGLYGQGSNGAAGDAGPYGRGGGGGGGSSGGAGGWGGSGNGGGPGNGAVTNGSAGQQIGSVRANSSGGNTTSSGNGGGGGGQYGGGGGSGAGCFPAGSGGGLGYKNNIAVSPGQTYTVVVGYGGAANSGNAAGNGGGGGCGGVRIIWPGTSRQFPSTGNLGIVGTETVI